ncbi:unnamed protein product [Leptosia nina]|uniref:Uncharacterized protein n=1 Tax=Leptosia nina TaxID=320188 RepID=A0AAV1IV31_9NEOP
MEQKFLSVEAELKVLRNEIKVIQDEIKKDNSVRNKVEQRTSSLTDYLTIEPNTAEVLSPGEVLKKNSQSTVSITAKPKKGTTSVNPKSKVVTVSKQRKKEREGEEEREKERKMEKEKERNKEGKKWS